MKIKFIDFVGAAFLTMLFMSTAGLNLQAQGFQGGLVFGGNFSQLDGDDMIGFNQPGFNGGAMVLTPLSRKLSMGLELLMSQQGSRRGAKDGISPFHSIRLQYIEVPLMAHFNDWRFRFSAGFSYGNLFQYKVEDISGDDVTEFNDYRQHNLAFLAGATYHISDHWGVECRWSRMLLPVNQEAGARSLLGRMISLRFVYIFNPVSTALDEDIEE